MKNLVVILLATSTFWSCKKHIETPESEALTTSKAVKACFIAKDLPNLSKNDIWIEGEIDGKAFSISPNKNMSVRNTLANFLGAGYKKDYARTYEWQGNGLTVYPIVDSVDTKALYDFYINVNYPTFQGDSLAYLQYFNQFQKGKTFKFRKGETPLAQAESGTVEINVLVGIGCTPSATNGKGISSSAADQTDSYFRVADVKEYKSVNGQIYRRDVTMEFDVKIGYGEVLRIKNGRLFFSY